MEEEWMKEWQEGEADIPDDGYAWIRSKPAEVKKVMIDFPPSCIVRANRQLRCPAPGTHGVVASYFQDQATKEVTIGVRQNPSSDMVAQCEPGWLEVVGVWKGFDSEKVKAIIEMPNILKS